MDSRGIGINIMYAIFRASAVLCSRPDGGIVTDLFQPKPFLASIQVRQERTAEQPLIPALGNALLATKKSPVREPFRTM